MDQVSGHKTCFTDKVIDTPGLSSSIHDPVPHIRYHILTLIHETPGLVHNKSYTAIKRL